MRNEFCPMVPDAVLNLLSNFDSWLRKKKITKNLEKYQYFYIVKKNVIFS